MRIAGASGRRYLSLGNAIRVRSGRRWWQGLDIKVVHRRWHAAKANAATAAIAQARNIGRAGHTGVGRLRAIGFIAQRDALTLARLLAAANHDGSIRALHGSATLSLRCGKQVSGKFCIGLCSVWCRWPLHRTAAGRCRLLGHGRRSPKKKRKDCQNCYCPSRQDRSLAASAKSHQCHLCNAMPTARAQDVTR